MERKFSIREFHWGILPFKTSPFHPKFPDFLGKC